jgi:hypothetical protein
LHDPVAAHTGRTHHRAAVGVVVVAVVAHLDACLREAVATRGDLAARHAVVGVHGVAVVALLEAAEHQAVAADGNAARGRAVGRVAVLRPEITLFARVDDTVAARLAGLAVAVSGIRVALTFAAVAVTISIASGLVAERGREAEEGRVAVAVLRGRARDQREGEEQGYASVEAKHAPC